MKWSDELPKRPLWWRDAPAMSPGQILGRLTAGILLGAFIVLAVMTLVVIVCQLANSWIWEVL